MVNLLPLQVKTDHSLPSVLVGCPTAYMKEYALERYVELLRSLTYGNYSVIMVDNSPDHTYAAKVNAMGIPCGHVERGPSARGAITKSQQKIREYFLNGYYDYFMSIEQDVFPPNDIIERLMAHKKFAVAATYFTFKGNGRVPCLYEERTDVDAMFLPEWEGQINGQLMRVHGCGFGCALYRREVIEQIEFRFNPDDQMGSDRYFYKDLKKVGYPMFMDTAIVCEHDNRQWTKENVPDR